MSQAVATSAKHSPSRPSTTTTGAPEGQLREINHSGPVSAKHRLPPRTTVVAGRHIAIRGSKKLLWKLFFQNISPPCRHGRIQYLSCP